MAQAKPLEKWIRALERQCRQAAGVGFHGTIRVVFHDGTITRIVVESSHIDPDALAPEQVQSQGQSTDRS